MASFYLASLNLSFRTQRSGERNLTLSELCEVLKGGQISQSSFLLLRNDSFGFLESTQALKFAKPKNRLTLRLCASFS